MAFEITPLFYERVINGFVLLLSLLLFYQILHVSNMEEREFCYNYINSAYCICKGDVEQLLNDSIRITVKDVIQSNSLLKNEEKEKEFHWNLPTK